MKSKKGFTLVELLAVIAILGIIAIIVVPNILENFNDSKKNALIDEAKIIYNEATNKYLKEKMNGNKISVINNENNTLDIESSDVTYTIRLDKDGNVTALKIKKGKYCIAGTGDFVLDMSSKDVIDLEGVETDICEDNTLMDGEIISVKLNVKNTSRPIINDVIPDIIYLKYNNGWYDKETTKGKAITSVEIVPSKRNFYFSGYKLSENEKLIIDYAGKILLDSKGYIGEELILNSINQTNSKAFAVFDKKYYKVRFNPNNGSGSMADVIVNYGENVNLPNNEINRVGYTFIEWEDNFGNKYNNGGSLPYIDDDNEDALPDFKYNVTKVLGNGEDNIVTFKAIWKANEYTLTFNPNGGSVSPTTKKVTYDSVVGSLPIPSYSGYTFDGWYTANTGGTKVTESTIYQTPSNSNLYARYITCPAGSYCPGGNQIFTCAAGTYAIAGASSCTTCPSGYYTNTGNDTGASSCTKCEAGNSCNGKTKTPCAAGTYAIAGASSCTTCNSGYYTNTGNNAGASSCTKCEAGNYCNGKIKTPCAAGTYAIAGASSCTTCNSGYYTNKGDSTGASSCTKCEAGNSCNGKTKTVCAAGSYALAGASSCTKCAIGSYNSSTGSSSCTACAKGKTTSSTGSTSCGVNCSNSSNVSSWNTPSWSNNTLSNLCSISGCNTGYHLSSNSCVENTYSIAYNSNGGSGSMSNTSCTYGSNCTLRSNSFSRTNYTFLGWSTSSSATSATYTNGVNVSNLTSTNNGSVTLYAVWKANYKCTTGTLTADSSRGSSSGGYICVTSGESYSGTCTDYDDCETYCKSYEVVESFESTYDLICTCTGQAGNKTYKGTSKCFGNCNSKVCPSGSTRSGSCSGSASCSGSCSDDEQGDSYTISDYKYCWTDCKECASYGERCSTYSCTKYRCPSGWNNYSGSGSSLKCYKNATQ